MSSSEDSNNSTVVVHLWTCPRSLSTATMYSFGHRPDTAVVDEPLYAHWLQRHPDVFRPYRDELFAAQKADGNEVLQDLMNRNDKPVIFLKHVAKQFVDINKSILYHPRARHVFLVRNPMDMILAWERKAEVHKEDCSLETLGLPIMCELYSDIRRNTQEDPIVVDSDLLKQYPREVLTELCNKLKIPFHEEQLKWEAGPKPNMDGLWASYWYDSVHKSTGFDENGGTTNTQYRSFDAEQLALYRESLPFYELLRRKAIGVDPINPGSSNTRLFLGSNSQGATIIDHGIVMNISGTRLADARNEHILAWIGDRLWPRELAKVSVFDSAVQGGDAVWEGLRVYQGKIFKLNEHLQRLIDSSKAMAFAAVPSLDYIKQAIFTTLAANGMRDGVHIRLTLTRGAKVTSSMNPAFNIFGTNLIVLPEWKPVGDMATYDNQKGIKLVTATNRRNSAQCVDSKIHHCNLINNSTSFRIYIFFVFVVD